jgi:hypothetical protein
MAKNMDAAEKTVRLLRTLTIVQLGLAGVGQAQIRKIVGGAMSDITDIVKLLNSGKRGRVGNGR